MAKRYLDWLQSQKGLMPLEDRPAGKFRAPKLAFNVRLKPEIAYQTSDGTFVTYLWATKLPSLTTQAAGAGIWMLREELAKGKFQGAQFQIRDLRNNRTFDESVMTNQSESILNADLALLNAIWVATAPLAA